MGVCNEGILLTRQSTGGWFYFWFFGISTPFDFLVFLSL